MKMRNRKLGIISIVLGCIMLLSLVPALVLANRGLTPLGDDTVEYRKITSMEELREDGRYVITYKNNLEQPISTRFVLDPAAEDGFCTEIEQDLNTPDVLKVDETATYMFTVTAVKVDSDNNTKIKFVAKNYDGAKNALKLTNSDGLFAASTSAGELTLKVSNGYWSLHNGRALTFSDGKFGVTTKGLEVEVPQLDFEIWTIRYTYSTYVKLASLEQLADFDYDTEFVIVAETENDGKYLIGSTPYIDTWRYDIEDSFDTEEEAEAISVNNDYPVVFKMTTVPEDSEFAGQEHTSGAYNGVRYWGFSKYGLKSRDNNYYLYPQSMSDTRAPMRDKGYTEGSSNNNLVQFEYGEDGKIYMRGNASASYLGYVKNYIITTTTTTTVTVTDKEGNVLVDDNGQEMITEQTQVSDVKYDGYCGRLIQDVKELIDGVESETDPDTTVPYFEDNETETVTETTDEEGNVVQRTTRHVSTHIEYTAEEAERLALQIYVAVPEDPDKAPVVVKYVGEDGEPVSVAYAYNQVTLSLGREIKDVEVEGEDYSYTFIGWTMRDDLDSYRLTLDESCNVYAYDSGYMQDEETKIGQGRIKEEINEKYGVLGDCNPDMSTTVVNFADRNIQPGETVTFYPVFAVRGFDTVVTANDTAAVKGGLSTKADGDIPVVGVSDFKSDPTVQGDDYYDNAEAEKWLGYIDVQMFKDGVEWGEPARMYFRYHNDCAADLNIKFIWDNLVNGYEDTLYETTTNPKAIKRSNLYMYMSDNAVYPLVDQTDSYVIDAVRAVQDGSEDGLKYKYNWMTDHGGKLDNVVGGTTVQVFVSTKYNVKYYLDDELITTGVWAYDPEHPVTYTTPGTMDRFDAEEKAAPDIINPNNKKPTERYLVRPDSEDIKVRRLLDPTYTDGSFIEDGENNRGVPHYFSYVMHDYEHEILFEKSPEELVAQGRTLRYGLWMLKDADMVIQSKHAWSSVHKLEGFEQGSDPSTVNAYKEQLTKDATTGSSPYTFHLYAYTTIPGNLVITNEIKGPGAEAGKQFHYTIELDDENINGTYGDLTFVDGKANFTLGDGDSLDVTGLPGGVSYTITEDDANTGGYKTTSNIVFNGDIPEDDTAHADYVNEKPVGDLIITNTVKGEGADPEKEFHYTIELDDKTVNGKYGDVTFVDGKAEFTLKDGEDVTVKGLYEGTKYTVTETDANTDGYTTNQKVFDGTIPADDAARADYVNEKPVDRGDLIITNTVKGEGADPEKEFHYTIELDDDTINGTYGDVTFKDGKAEFTLKDGEDVTVKGLPDGVKYTVTETDANEDGYTTNQKVFEGTIPANETVRADYVNEKPLERGDLIITNTVKGEGADPEKEFHYTIELDDDTINGTYGDVTFKDGKAEFTLKDGEEVIVKGLPEGVGYKVTETDADTDGYTTNQKVFEGTIPADETVRADYINEKPLDPTETPEETPTPKPTETVKPTEPPKPEETPTPEPTEIPETEAPTPEPTENTLPNTGDSSLFGLWIMLMVVAVAGAAVVTIARRSAKAAR